LRKLSCLDLGMTSADIRTEPKTETPGPGVSPQLTAEDVAAVLRIGSWSVVQLCRTGQLRASKPGKSWLIDPADLRAYLDAHSNQAASA
jgi:excisionase family DNA binding protein